MMLNARRVSELLALDDSDGLQDVMPQQNPTSGLALLLLQRRYRQQLREADAPAQAAQQVACRLSSSAFACKAYFSRSSLTCKAC